MNKKYGGYFFSIFLLSSITLFGCGSSGGKGTTTTSTTGTTTTTVVTKTGVFEDSVVEGVAYKTATKSGKTNALGEYDYVEGETVTFSIGGIEFPPVSAKPRLTPLDLFKTTDINVLEVVNAIRLLQTLDTDGDPTNGITISIQVHTEAAALTTIDFASPNFDADVAAFVTNSGAVKTVLVDAATAINHFQSTINTINGKTALIGSWIISGVTNQMAGVVTFIDSTQYAFANHSLDPICSDGMELGHYSWDAATGAFSIKVGGNIIDTDQDCGLHEPSPSTWTNATAAVNGNVLTLTPQGEAALTFNKVTDPNNPLVGGWIEIVGTETTVTTFVDNTRYLMVVGRVPAESFCPNGMEHGSYSFAGNKFSVTGSFADTNADCGFHDDLGVATLSDVSLVLNGDTLTWTFPDAGPSGTSTYHRIGSGSPATSGTTPGGTTALKFDAATVPGVYDAVFSGSTFTDVYTYNLDKSGSVFWADISATDTFTWSVDTVGRLVLAGGTLVQTTAGLPDRYTLVSGTINAGTFEAEVDDDGNGGYESFPTVTFTKR